MSLSDADLDRFERLVSPTQYGAEAVALVAEVRALRAKVVGGTDGPDQGDPAAWVYRDSWGHIRATDKPDEARTLASMGVDMEPVVPLRAPGAVAAAPPGDEDPFDSPPSAWDGTYDPLTGAPTVPDDDAPPAGHEDEAAVERVAQALEEGWPCNLSGWEETTEQDRYFYRARARRVLAAARGPRTPDPGEENR